MTHPAQQSATADPEARRNDQPENAPPDCAIVNLADAGNEKAQNRRCPWFAHNTFLLHMNNTTAVAKSLEILQRLKHRPLSHCLFSRQYKSGFDLSAFDDAGCDVFAEGRAMFEPVA